MDLREDEDPTRTHTGWTDRTPPHYRKHGWAKQGARFDEHEPWPFMAKVLVVLTGALAFLCWISR